MDTILTNQQATEESWEVFKQPGVFPSKVSAGDIPNQK